MYLLDTNICIYAINKRSDVVIHTIKKKYPLGISLSSLTLAELEYGVENSKSVASNRIALLKFTSIFSILNFDDADAVSYGKLKAQLKKNGQIIGPIDMLLAAQAISKGLVFVTNNVREFERVEGLTLEDWTLTSPTP